MAAFGDLLQRISRSLEEAGAQRPGDDLRARLGYGAEDHDEDELASETAWEPAAARGAETVRASEAARDTGDPRTRTTAWAAKPPRAPARSRPSATHHAPSHDRASGGGLSAAAEQPHPHAANPSRVSERLRARLHAADTLREAIVLKEILDRPLGQRPRR